MNNLDIWNLYELMAKSRYFEESVKDLWEKGKIYGEMHLGLGEEAIIAGIVSQLQDGDAMALDHRGTAPLLIRGINPVALLLEFLGHQKGLCSGNGGHMHLFSKEHLVASSGIVGASGPAAAGFAFALKYKKTNNIAVAFFGEGAMNQGMMLESLNLASVWELPLLFVCKDNGWAIATRSSDVTGGSIITRVKGFGIDGAEVNGYNVAEVANIASTAIAYIRTNKKPFFIQAKCTHMEGHFLGDPLLRFKKDPIKEFGKATMPLIKSVLNPKGCAAAKRAISIKKVFGLIFKSFKQKNPKEDPLIEVCRLLLNDKDKVSRINARVKNEVDEIFKKALSVYEGE